MSYYDDCKLSTDYENRCGNCHSHLNLKDKYCRYCGTPVGEGAFEPYKNETYCVYGPPVKELWCCPDCGYKWRSVVMGGDHAKFCPICGSSKLNVLESVAKAMFDDYTFTVDADVVDLEQPQYFSADEVELILKLRSNDVFDKTESLKKLIEAGFIECEKAIEYDEAESWDQYPKMTDREAERVNMELFMLEHVKGDRPYLYPHVQCPKCKGNVVSVVLEKRKSSPNLPERSLKRGLYEPKGAKAIWNSGNYHCLLCDKYFD